MDFDLQFEQLTGYKPLPWQGRLHKLLVQGEFPSQCHLPTGLGKTSVLAVWLLALAEQVLENRPLTIPRRLVYVVNRRTVVDQATSEAEKLRRSLCEKPGLKSVRELLASLSSQATTREEPLAISTMRGQFADNGEWMADPARPAIIVGTVDMIGSRLLFSGYRVGFKHRPLHAAYLGQDVLLVHDEAHMEQPFQKLINSITEEQAKEKEPSRNVSCQKPFYVMALSATQRHVSQGEDLFQLEDEDFQHPVVKQRLQATKQLYLHSIDEKEKDLVKVARQLAVEKTFEDQAILVYFRKVDDILQMGRELEKAGIPTNQILTLTGTIRGQEREQIVETKVFRRFIHECQDEMESGRVFLLSTSAGEVGINITADHLICDLTPFDSMAQRFGRVNRFGIKPAQIHVLHPTSFDAENKMIGQFELARQSTLKLLSSLKRDEDNILSASPHALEAVEKPLREKAFTPCPVMKETTDVLLDAWTMTTIKAPLPGRPPVEQWLHGEATWEPPRTQIAWRAEVELVESALLENQINPEDLLEAYPLKAMELLSDSTERVHKELVKLSAKHGQSPIWLISDEHKIERMLLDDITTLVDAKRAKVLLGGATVLLSPLVGGLNSQHMLDGGAAANIFEHENRLRDAINGRQLDIADMWMVHGERQRQRVYQKSDDSWKLKLSIRLKTISDDELSDTDANEVERTNLDDGLWNWYVCSVDDADEYRQEPQNLDEHLEMTEIAANELATSLSLPGNIKDAIVLAARLHDLGKHRDLWQKSIGNFRYQDGVILAKSGDRRRRNLSVTYRHEFGSLHDVRAQKEFQALGEESQDLVLHLIGAHHGRARPHFPTDLADGRDESYDPNYVSAANEALASQIPSRFARLQRKFGRWGLAYLESLVRSADIIASKSLKYERTKTLPKLEISLPQRTIVPSFRKFEPSIRIDVDVTNPGQFFACCGLLELADRLWPGAEGWFEEREFCVACEGTLPQLLKSLTECKFEPEDPENATSSPLLMKAPFNLRLDWWHDQLSGGRDLKVWAGTMEGLRIARAMQATMASPQFATPQIFDIGMIAFDADNSSKKVEPFYFDARRGPNAHSRDVGFSTNTLSYTSTAHPAVELLCLIGLQRLTPQRKARSRLFRYASWKRPIPAQLIPAVALGEFPTMIDKVFEFENWYRTGQKKHKAFLPAVPLLNKGAT